MLPKCIKNQHQLDIYMMRLINKFIISLLEQLTDLHLLSINNNDFTYPKAVRTKRKYHSICAFNFISAPSQAGNTNHSIGILDSVLTI